MMKCKRDGCNNEIIFGYPKEYCSFYCKAIETVEKKQCEQCGKVLKIDLLDMDNSFCSYECRGKKTGNMHSIDY